VDRNYFYSSGIAVIIQPGAKNTLISGSYFGFDQTEAYQSFVGPTAWIQDEGDNTIIGVNPSTSSDSSAPIQGNLFSAVVLTSSILYGGNSTTISGNRFGYEPTTGLSPLSVSTSGMIISPIGSPTPCILTIGSNGDSSGDDKEGNWFGCSSNIMSAAISLDSTTTVTIAGNYFGFNPAGSPNGMTVLPSLCQPQIWVLSSGDTVLGDYQLAFMCALLLLIPLLLCLSFIFPIRFINIPERQELLPHASVNDYIRSLHGWKSRSRVRLTLCHLDFPLFVNTTHDRNNMFGTNCDGSLVPLPSNNQHILSANPFIRLTVTSNVFVSGGTSVLVSQALRVIISNNNFG